MLDRQNYPEQCFERADSSDDALFYREPRKVVHIDDGAIAALTGFLAEQLPSGGNYLDLMSSWRSHLPPDSGVRVTGLGMNDEELAENPQLDEWVVHDLNADPQLPFDDRTFDAVICTVSVQYMVRPLETFLQVNRVLKPGAPFVVSFPIAVFRKRPSRYGWRPLMCNTSSWWNAILARAGQKCKVAIALRGATTRSLSSGPGSCRSPSVTFRARTGSILGHYAHGG